MNIIGHKYIFLSFSGLLVIASTFAFSWWGLRQGIDYTGGSLLEVTFVSSVPKTSEIKAALERADIRDFIVQPTAEKGAIIKFGHIDEESHQKIISELKALPSQRDLREERFDSIGPTIGNELRRNAIIAVILSIICIVLYIAWAFRKVSTPVSSWKYGLATVIALVHDVVIPVGFFALLGRFRGVEIDALFITALLTILGFSVHDTIVVFDRIRENLRKQKQVESFESTVNRSMNETLGRSINTSLTVLLVLTAIFFFGGETTKYFSLALILGILFGTYSSIFVASPLLVVWNNFTSKPKSS